MSTKPGLANDPFPPMKESGPAAVDVAQASAAPTEAPKRTGRPKGTGTRPASKTRSVTFSQTVLEDALNAVDFLKDDPNTRVSFTQLVEQALFTKVNELREQHNGGKPFPQREGNLKPGPR